MKVFKAPASAVVAFVRSSVKPPVPVKAASAVVTAVSHNAWLVYKVYALASLVYVDKVAAA